MKAFLVGTKQERSSSSNYRFLAELTFVIKKADERGHEKGHVLRNCITFPHRGITLFYKKCNYSAPLKLTPHIHGGAIR